MVELHEHKVSRALTLMGYTRKILEKQSEGADQALIEAYFVLDPPHGINGVPRERLVDVDETGVWLACIRRKYGHAPKGEKAGTKAPYNVGKKYTAIIAIDMHGVVAYQVMDVKGTSSVIWYHFVNDILLPEIRAPHGEEHVPRLILMDNLAAHHNRVTLELIAAAGHAHTFRPPRASIELGSIEYAMNVLKCDLRQHWPHIDQDNLLYFVEDAICRLTASQCVQFFRHTGH